MGLVSDSGEASGAIGTALLGVIVCPIARLLSFESDSAALREISAESDPVLQDLLPRLQLMQLWTRHRTKGPRKGREPAGYQLLALETADK